MTPPSSAADVSAARLAPDQTSRDKTGETDEVAMLDFELSLPMRLMRAREAVMGRFRPVLAEHDLTEQQWRVLRALHHADEHAHGPLSVGELADRTMLLGPSLARMLTSLEQRGLIDRQPAADARRAEIRISSCGRRTVRDVWPFSEAVYRDIEGALGESDFDELNRLLAKLGDVMIDEQMNGGRP